ncbi:MAG: rRNA-processing protein bfr2 [Alyxoria varia]|nr:MAG: rRNA-processing protein bfr2 [Alyxoria varia]
MPGLKQSRIRADEFADLTKHKGLADIDPEDDVQVSSDSEDVSSEEDHDDARGHYETVGKSKLRKPDLAFLGPQYEGSRVDRKSVLEEGEENDPLGDYGSDSFSDDPEQLDRPVRGDVEDSSKDDLSDESESQSEGPSAEGHDESDDGSLESADEDDLQLKTRHGTTDSLSLRQLVNQERRSVTASMAEANKADAEKGRAVKRQRTTFDGLLNSRINLQQGLIAMNSMPLAGNPTEDNEMSSAAEAAEQAALKLWNNIDSLRQSLVEEKTGNKRKRLHAAPSTSNTAIWKQMQDSEKYQKPHRQNVLQKWSKKTQPITTKPAANRLNLSQSSGETTVMDVIDAQMSNTERLVQRTRVPRSCAPLQASSGRNRKPVEPEEKAHTEQIDSSSSVFDDADFYGMLLKELLEQRSSANANSSSQAAEQWEAARKTAKEAQKDRNGKQTETRASKGRKLRYTVHERLQNFMAPEDRGSWEERQVNELFRGLLGRKQVDGREAGANGHHRWGDGDGDGDIAQETALRLFRS